MGRAEQKSPAPRRLALVAALAAGLGLAAAGCSAGQITQTDNQVASVNGASGQAGAIAVRDAQLLFPVEEGYYREADNAPVVVTIANNGDSADKLLSVTSEASGEAEITGDVDLEPASSVSGGADRDDAGSAHPTTTTGPSSSGSSVTSTTSLAASASSVQPSGSPESSGTTGSSPATTTLPSSPATTSGGSSSISNPPTTTRRVQSSVEPTEPGKVKIVLKGFKSALRPGQTIKVTFLFQNAGPLTLDVPIGATPEPRKEGASEH